MDNNTFYLKELELISHIKTSKLYQKLQYLSAQISADEELNKLAKERDDCYQRANDVKENRDLLIQAKILDDTIKNKPLVLEYLSCYNQLKKILNILEEGILKKIK